MTDVWRRRLAWSMGLSTIVILISSTVLLFSAPDYYKENWLWSTSHSIVNLGAPILGLVIVTREPRQRIGWLLFAFGFFACLMALGHAIYYFSGSKAEGYSALADFFLWGTEAGNLGVLTCQALLMLWFPTGFPPSKRWRMLYFPLFGGIAMLSTGLFVVGPEWNGGPSAGGIVINNPYGFLQTNSFSLIGFSAFLTVLICIIMAAFSLVVRYRSASQIARLQLRWFVLGGLFYILITLNFFFVSQPDRTLVFHILSSTAFLPLYLAVGLAILRYRLYDIDVIIRKTLVYSVLSAALGLVYFGTIILLQTIIGDTESEQSPLVIVVSTLLIAALFFPLRRRIQAFIDRRFYRQKYDAAQTLARFAQTARDEVELEKLSAGLVEVVEQTMRPESIYFWFRSDKRRK